MMFNKPRIAPTNGIIQVGLCVRSSHLGAKGIAEQMTPLLGLLLPKSFPLKSTTGSPQQTTWCIKTKPFIDIDSEVLSTNIIKLLNLVTTDRIVSLRRMADDLVVELSIVIWSHPKYAIPPRSITRRALLVLVEVVDRIGMHEYSMMPPNDIVDEMLDDASYHE